MLLNESDGRGRPDLKLRTNYGAGSGQALVQVAVRFLSRSTVSNMRSSMLRFLSVDHPTLIDDGWVGTAPNRRQYTMSRLGAHLRSNWFCDIESCRSSWTLS